MLDTSVVVSALRSRAGASSRLLRSLPGSTLRAVATPALIFEYEEVLKRPDQRLATGLSISHIDAFLFDFANLLHPVEPHFRWRPQLRDPDDEFVLEAAVNGRVSALVTHNVRDFTSATIRFVIETLTPGDILKRLMS